MKKFYLVLFYLALVSLLFSQSEQTYFLKESELIQLELNLKQLESINKTQQEKLKTQEQQLIILDSQLVNLQTQLEQATQSLKNADKLLKKSETETKWKIVSSILVSITVGFCVGKLVPF